jgi:hypothetical protein
MKDVLGICSCIFIHDDDKKTLVKQKGMRVKKFLGRSFKSWSKSCVAVAAFVRSSSEVLPLRGEMEN